jgi:hypothetical protein
LCSAIAAYTFLGLCSVFYSQEADLINLNMQLQLRFMRQ